MRATFVLCVALSLGPTLAPVWAQAELRVIASRGFALKDDTLPPIDNSARKFSYVARTHLDPLAHRFVRPAFDSSGDPTPLGSGGGGAVMTIYNTAGTGEQWTIVLPTSQWYRAGTPETGRYVFNGGAGAAVAKIYVKHDKITIRGGRNGWGYTLDEPAQGGLAMRLTFGAETHTWCAPVVPRAPASTFDRRDRFQAEVGQGIVPSSCPPL